MLERISDNVNDAISKPTAITTHTGNTKTGKLLQFKPKPLPNIPAVDQPDGAA